jgi:hypothetical protein
MPGIDTSSSNQIGLRAGRQGEPFLAACRREHRKAARLQQGT